MKIDRELVEKIKAFISKKAKGPNRRTDSMVAREFGFRPSSEMNKFYDFCGVELSVARIELCEAELAEVEDRNSNKCRGLRSGLNKFKTVYVERKVRKERREFGRKHSCSLDRSKFDEIAEWCAENDRKSKLKKMHLDNEPLRRYYDGPAYSIPGGQRRPNRCIGTPEVAETGE